MKALHFCQLMMSLGHEVYHYGAEGSQTGSTEDVMVMTRAEQEGFFGPYDPTKLSSMKYDTKEPFWQLMNTRTAAVINTRKRRGDFVCVITGNMNIPLAGMVGNDVMTVEYGIGYSGTFAKYRVFESYTHMHKTYGAESGYDPNGNLYDAVIPNYLNPDEYPFQATKGDYYLYIGRLTRRKGIQIAVETCKHLGAKLVLAGPGCQRVEGNRIYCTDGGVYEGDNLRYAGCVLNEQKAALYGGAIATFVPTLYLEPFGAVVIESQMTGTPTITTDFGAFVENVEHGKTGFRCRTLEQFIWAANHAYELDPAYIRTHTINNYSMDRVRWMYQEYFEMLTTLWGKGWNTLNPGRLDLDWLRKY
jgi:glycosyltransferase involved in cell wall biosynthesis